MKKLLLLFIMSLSVNLTFSQINMGNLGTVTNGCGQTFYDPQGTSNYANGQNYTATFCAPAGQYLSFNFTSFSTESCCDHLYIYNGPTTGSPLIGQYQGTTGPGTVYSTLGGCLTFLWTSDGSITSSGWVCPITCVTTIPATPPPGPGSCAGAQPFCTSSGVTFPGSVGTTSEVGPNYGCLFSQPSPAWYYLNIATAGNIMINLSNSAAHDIDFAIWGPFATQASMCAGLTSTPIDCSYSTSATETVDIPNAVVGQWYMLLITNYANTPTNISAIAGNAAGTDGTTNCNILCNMTGLSATPGPCVSPANTYSVTGSITLAYPPTSGTLTVSSSCGGSVIVPTPWNSPVSYTLPGLTANGAACNITAVFSADPTCTLTTPYTAPAACMSACAISSLTATPGSCLAGNTYNVAGSIAFTSPPASGTLTVTNTCGGTQTFNAPFVSPLAYSLNGLTANGLPCTVSASFSATPCSLTQNYTAPALPLTNAGADQLVCAGAPVTLSGSGANTYSWNNSVTNATAFTPAATATYTLTGTSVAGCTATDQVLVTVNPIATANAGPAQAVCAGGVISLAGSVGGSATSGIWSASSGTFSNTASLTSTYTPSITSGTVTLTLTTNDPAGPCPLVTSTVVITINPLPIVNAGLDQTICPATSVTLSATGAPNYTWSGGITNGVAFTPAATATYTVTGTTALGCIASDAVIVTVNPLPIVNAGLDQTICLGASVTLSGAGASTYTWNNSVTNGIAFTPAATATYTVTGTSIAGCVNTDQVLVTVNPLPVVVANNVSVCSGGTVALTATGASTYTWSPGTYLNTTIGSSVNFTAGLTTTYTITGTSTAGCISTDLLTVSVLANAPVNAGPDVAICVGSSTTLTAIGGLTYNWNNGLGLGNNFSVSPAATTTYTVVGTDAGGCTGTDAVTITVNPLPVVGAGLDQTVCAGTSVSLTGSGASTYSWDNSITNTVSFVPSATATYTVTGTSIAGCINTDQVIVTVNVLPIVNAGIDQTVCAGTSVILTGAGASTYSWTGGITNGVSFTPIATSNYTVTGTSVAGCTSTDIVTVTVNPLPIVNAGVDQTICIGASVTLSGAGASVYTWDNGVVNTVPFSPVATVTYTVTGTSSAGCIATDQVIVTVNPLPIVNAGMDQTVCAGVAVTLFGSGASTYSWDNGITNGLAFVPSSTTTYTVTGTSAAGCINTDQVLVTVNPLPIVNAGVDQIVCAGTAVTLTGIGASAYTWSGGVIDGVAFTPTATANYTVSGTSAAGCVSTDIVTVTVNPLPTTNAGVDQTVCSGTGVTLTAIGATTYTWNNGVTNGIAFTPAVGSITYTVIGTTGAGCTATDQVIVTVNPNPVPLINGPSTYCTGNFALLSTTTPFTTYSWSTGALTPTINATIANNPISVTVTNGFGCIGTSPVFPIIENNVITANFTNTICQGQSSVIHGVSQTVAGVYSQTFMLATGCDSVAIVTLVVNPLPIVNAGVDQAVCTGLATTLSASGASTYNWNNGITNGISFSQPIGSVTYTVTGTSALGCLNTDQVIITVNPLPIINAGVDQAICIGASTSLSGAGASSFTWNNGVANGISFAPAITNTYTITGTDINGCINTDQVVVAVNPLPIVNAGIDQTICIGASVTLSATNASTYTWNNGITNGLAFAPVSTLTYSVSGTDINGCINTDQVNVTVNPLPIVNAGLDQVICIGASTTLNGSGASSYTWNNGVSNNVVFSPSATTTYTITGTDLNGCINTDQAVITVNPLPIVGAGIDQAICIGAFSTISGAGALSYTWNNGVTNSIAFSPAITNTYTVTGTDINGCINTDQVVITVNALPSVNAGLDQIACIGGIVSLSGVGASTYTWDNGITNALAFSPLATATYTVTGTDGNGCINTDQAIVTVNPLPVVNAGIDQTVCFGTSVTLSGAGANTYSWDNAITDGVSFIPVVGTLTYTVTGTSGANCIATDQVDITVNPIPAVGAGVDQVVCAGISVTLSGSGATTYSWDNGVTNGVAFVPVSTATYTVIGTSVLGCSFMDQVLVTVNPIPNVFAGNDFILCENQTATLTGTGATTYSWDNGVSNGLAFTPSVGSLVYTVIGTTAFGCTDTDQMTILVNPLPAVSFLPGETLGCVPITTSLTNTSPNSVNCVWTISNGNVLTGCGPLSTTFNQPGCYDITLTTTDVNGCSNSYTAIDIVCAEAYPIAAFTPSESVMTTISTEVLFMNNSIGASDYSWDLGDNSPLSNVVNPIHTYLEQEGTYVVTLIASTPLGCADTAYATIQINEALLFYVPNTFTPDEDDYNPNFQPVFTSGFDPYDYDLLIFNRWGEIIFESHDASVGWNGSYGSYGEIILCEDGTYTWKIEFKTSINDERKMIVGHVNVIR